MMDVLMLKIPVPPSNNRFVRTMTSRKTGKPIFYTPADVKTYRQQVISEYFRQGKGIRFGTLDVVIDITAYLSVMTRDVDNIPKEIFDSLKMAGVFKDDRQIVEFSCRKIRAKDAGTSPHCFIVVKRA